MQRAWWVCAAVLVFACGCGDDDGAPAVDAGEDTGSAGAGATSGSGGSAGIAGTGGSGGVAATGGSGGTGGNIDDAGTLDAQMDGGPMCDCPSPQACDGDAGACRCPSGYVLAGDTGELCEDIDECATDNGGCDDNATCTNMSGTFECTCNLGFEGDGVTCEDDCVVALRDRCDVNAICEKPNGSAECRCSAGYIDVGSGEPGTNCEVDPICMQLGCDPLAGCDSTDAMPACECPAGYADPNGDGTLCEDIDECASNNGGCDDNAACVNTSGGFGCTCDSGYSGDGFVCTDNDECMDSTHTCSVNAACTNTAGSFTCACNVGTFGNGMSCSACTAIAGCASGLSCTTNSNQACAMCAPGFVGDGTAACVTCPSGAYDSNNACVDCGTIANCVTVETCDVTNGTSLVCPTCATGFRGDGTGTCAACTAIANCASGLTCTTNSNQTCGTCAPGYIGDGSGTCTACMSGTYDSNNACVDCGTVANCNVTETCNVTNGNALVCPSCSPGYIGDGTGTCTACASGTYDNNNVCTTCSQITNCSATETCNVTNGTNSICPTCAPGYRGNGTGACTACTAIANCASGLTCTSAGNQTCGTCAPGYVGDGTGTCTACASGTYDNNNVCTTCSQITNCSATETCNVTNGSNSICPTCAPGYRGNGTGACTACTAIANCASGLTCTSAGNQTCGTCAPGYVGDGTGTCTACGAGTYDNNNVCTTCSQITNCGSTETCNVTNGSNSICPTCAPGYRGNGTGTCTACTAIANCASGLTCTSAGNQTCGTCAPGYVGDGTGTCTLCAAGTYDNNNVCTTCPQVANCASNSMETCNVTNGSSSICPTCATGFSGNGTGTCADINECVMDTDTCDDSPDACVNNAGGYTCQCPTNHNDVNGNGSDCVLACNNCDANAACVLTAPSTYGCQCRTGFAGDGESCHCDLSGTWAVRIATTVDWPAVAFALQGGTATLYSYEVRTLDYDGTTLDASILPCGGNDAPLCGTGLWNNRAFGQQIPQSVWDSFAGNELQASMSLVDAVPDSNGMSNGTPFTTTNAAVYLGMEFSQRAITATTTNASNTLTAVSPIDQVEVGMEVFLANVPAGTLVTAVGATTITMSQNATGTAAASRGLVGLRQTFTADTTSGSNTIAGISPLAKLAAGMEITMAGVAAGTRITAVVGTNATLSANASATASGVMATARVNPRFTANVTNGSATLNGITSTAHLNVGLEVVCAGVPAGTTISTIPNGTSITLSANANATNMAAACLARVNDTSYWPPLGTANHIVFDSPEEPVVHDTLGAASNARTGAAPTCSNSHNYSRWPNLGNGNAFEVTAFRSGSRSIARFAGRVVSCDEIGGRLLGPDRNPGNTADVPRIDARFAGCTVTAGSSMPRACTAAEVTAFNNQQKTQRVLSSEFSMVRVADNATCAEAISAPYVDY